MELPDAWYVVASSNEIRKRPHQVNIFSKKFVLWRNSNGEIIMQDDVCPHRSASLSLGDIVDNCITCPFHGFAFDENGSCSFIPETGKPAPNLQIETFSIVERHSFVWLRRGENLSESPPWFNELKENLVSYQSIHEWPTHMSRCVENQLDYAHLPFVHKKTIGHDVDVFGPRRIDCDDRKISMYVNSQSDDIPTIQFMFPNLWLLTIKKDKFYQFIAFVPVAPGITRLYLRAYQGMFTLPLLSPLLGPIFNQLNSVILREDRRVVLSQMPLDTSQVINEKLFPSDRAIKHFRDLWKAGVQDFA